MPVYKLHCSFARSTGVLAPIYDSSIVHASTDAEAIEAAQVSSRPDASLVLVTAILRDPRGRVIWSMQSDPEGGYPDTLSAGAGI